MIPSIRHSLPFHIISKTYLNVHFLVWDFVLVVAVVGCRCGYGCGCGGGRVAKCELSGQ